MSGGVPFGPLLTLVTQLRQVYGYYEVSTFVGNASDILSDFYPDGWQSFQGVEHCSDVDGRHHYDEERAFAEGGRCDTALGPYEFVYVVGRHSYSDAELCEVVIEVIRGYACLWLCHSVILAFWHSGILAFWHSGILAFCHLRLRLYVLLCSFCCRITFRLVHARSCPETSNRVNRACVPVCKLTLCLMPLFLLWLTCRPALSAPAAPTPSVRLLPLTT